MIKNSNLQVLRDMRQRRTKIISKLLSNPIAQSGTNHSESYRCFIAEVQARWTCSSPCTAEWRILQADINETSDIGQTERTLRKLLFLWAKINRPVHGSKCKVLQINDANSYKESNLFSIWRLFYFHILSLLGFYFNLLVICKDIWDTDHTRPYHTRQHSWKHFQEFSVP